MTNQEANIIELHYWLNDESHSMDAFILNRSEWEIINLFKQIAEVTGVEIILESQAVSEGGVRQWFRITARNEEKKAAISTQVLTILISTIITTPIAIGSALLINKVSSDNEMEALNKEAKKQELLINQATINKLSTEVEFVEIQKKNIETDTKKKELEILILTQQVADNSKVQKRASNFYEEISKEKKISKITVNRYDSTTKEPKGITVEKSDFSNFILRSNELESIIDENAIIEIVSPVLKKGAYQWRGVYNGQTIGLNMRSNEFKTLVQVGDVEFKNGTCISCILEITRKTDNLGEEIITGYNINKVLSYFNGNNERVETLEGRKIRHKKKDDESQLNLFGDIENNTQ